jgi:hypothetical protein
MKVEKGIPLPPRNNARDGNGKYPFARMEVGDSFFIEADEQTAQRIQNRACNAYRYYRPKEFATRRIEGGIRIWRTA